MIYTLYTDFTLWGSWKLICWNNKLIRVFPFFTSFLRTRRTSAKPGIAVVVIAEGPRAGGCALRSSWGGRGSWRAGGATWRRGRGPSAEKNITPHISDTLLEKNGQALAPVFYLWITGVCGENDEKMTKEIDAPNKFNFFAIDSGMRRNLILNGYVLNTECSRKKGSHPDFVDGRRSPPISGDSKDRFGFTANYHRLARLCTPI